VFVCSDVWQGCLLGQGYSPCYYGMHMVVPNLIGTHNPWLCSISHVFMADSGHMTTSGAAGPILSHVQQLARLVGK
jgi:hypothetical protein